LGGADGLICWCIIEMQVYKVLTKYNVIEEMGGDNIRPQRRSILRSWGNKILLLMDRDDLEYVLDRDARGITINITDDINVNYAPNNMNITYQQIIDNPERNPVFTVNNMRISMYPNRRRIEIEVGPVKFMYIDINVAEGDVLFRTLMRGTRLYRNARNIGEINEPNENDGNMAEENMAEENMAEENVGSARRVGKKSGYNNSGNYPDAKKKKSSRKTRKARKN
jgi:hypothetical protein